MYPFHGLPSMFQRAFTFERVVATRHTFATVLLPVFIGAYTMGVLVQLPRTGFYRTALLPIILWLSFRASMSLDFSGGHPGYVYLNQSLALAMFSIAMRCTSWVLARQRYSKLPACKLDHDVTSDHNGDTHLESDVSVSSAMWNACDLLLDLRGVGWNGPQKVYIPTPYFRVESRPLFALLSFCQSISLILAYDIMCEVNRSFGRDTFARAEGDTIFDLSLPPPQRYLKSSIVTVLTTLNAYLLINGLYYLHATLFTILSQHHPSQWPPLFDFPWLSTSLTSFWGKRWHQLFHQVFVEVGGKPLERYLGKAGLVMGAFTLSGLLHEAGARGMGRGTFTLSTMGFFLIQGVGVVMEGAWKRATGKRVGGFFGWLWASFWLLSWGNILVDAWARSGLIGAEFAMDAYKPSTLFLNWISEKSTL